MVLQKPITFVPDEVFTKMSVQQDLQPTSLISQYTATARAPAFQIFPKQAFTDQGAWGAAFYESPLFQRYVAVRNAIELPLPIVAAIVAEQRPINPPYKPYLSTITDFVQHVGALAATATNAHFGTAFPTPNHVLTASGGPDAAWIGTFYNRLCDYILAMIDDLAPSLCSGALPLSTAAPGYDRG